MKMHVLLAGASLLIATPMSLATDIKLSALKDAMIFGTSANADTGNASGKGPGMFAGADGSLNRKRSLIQFDVAAANIPAYATINSVTMTLYLGQVAGSGGPNGGGNYPTRTISMYDLLQSWTEGNTGSPTSTNIGTNGQGFARTTGDVTWDYSSYNSADTTAGKWTGGLHGGNFSSTASATSSFTDFATLNTAFNWTGAGLVADVQAWVSGTATNFGWLLKSDNLEDSSASFLGFWTKDGAAANSNANIAPSLLISYTLPEPASLTFLAAGIALFARRNRRA